MYDDTTFHQDWQDILDAQGEFRSHSVATRIALTHTAEEDGSDDDYGRPRRKSKPQVKRPLPHTEVGRTTKHTLDENLDQMMSGSFDVSFLSGGNGEQRTFHLVWMLDLTSGTAMTSVLTILATSSLRSSEKVGLAPQSSQSWFFLPNTEGRFTLSSQAFRAGRASISYLF